MFATATALPPIDEQSTLPREATTLDAATPEIAAKDTAARDPMIGNDAPASLARPVPASDPLAAIKALTEEEKIALFT
jgi:hypothetical protein